MKYFDREYNVHSLHKFRESAVDIGQQIYESLPFDKDGDGVRLRRGTIGEGGLKIDDKVLWARYCKTISFADIIEKETVDEDEEDEELDPDISLAYLID